MKALLVREPKEKPIVPLVLSESRFKQICANRNDRAPFVNWFMRSDLGRELDAWMFQAERDREDLVRAYVELKKRLGEDI